MIGANMPRIVGERRAQTHLPLRCRWCNQPITVIVHPIDDAPEWTWECPYPSCRQEQVRQVGGIVLRALAGWSYDTVVHTKPLRW